MLPQIASAREDDSLHHLQQFRDKKGCNLGKGSTSILSYKPDAPLRFAATMQEMIHMRGIVGEETHNSERPLQNLFDKRRWLKENLGVGKGCGHDNCPYAPKERRVQSERTRGVAL